MNLFLSLNNFMPYHNFTRWPLPTKGDCQLITQISQEGTWICFTNLLNELFIMASNYGSTNRYHEILICTLNKCI